MAMLWPELDDRDASNNLHGALHQLRRAFEPELARGASSLYLPLQGQVLSLRAPDGLWIDVEAFGVACTIAQHAGQPEAYEAAIELYGGDLLPEDRFADWAIAARDKVRERFYALVLELAHLYESLEEYWAAIRCLDRLVMMDAVHEEGQAMLMRLYAQLGQRHRALRQYRLLQAALERELDAEPDASTVRLYEDILADRIEVIGNGLARPIPTWAQQQLSRREEEIVHLMADRLSNRDLAETLGVSPRTAETHVTHILHKLGLHSRGELADWAIARYDGGS
jgi:DNA-binding SARP family transcriptional activator